MLLAQMSPECLPDVSGRRKRVGSPVGPFRIHVDEAHLHRAERACEVPVAAVALVAEVALENIENVRSLG